MTKVLKILTGAVILFVLYMWGSLMFKSCNTKDEFKFDPSSKDKQASAPDSSFDEEFFEEDTTTTQTTPPAKIDYKEIDAVVDNTKESSSPTPIESGQSQKAMEKKVSPPPAVKEKPVAAKTAAPLNTGNSAGNFMVMCGSYKQESNADDMVKKLKQSGFANAQKITFDASTFHSVIAGKYTSQAEATKASSDLKQKGIDSYVKKMGK